MLPLLLLILPASRETSECPIANSASIMGDSHHFPLPSRPCASSPRDVRAPCHSHCSTTPPYCLGTAPQPGVPRPWRRQRRCRTNPRGRCSKTSDAENGGDFRRRLDAEPAERAENGAKAGHRRRRTGVSVVRAHVNISHCYNHKSSFFSSAAASFSVTSECARSDGLT